MRLATFIETARDPILEAAVEFARTIPALRESEEEVLRDHLPQLLQAVTADLRTSQSRTESIAKSRGEAPQSASETSAQTHGLSRARRGIAVEELMAEFRALRSSVLRLWADAHPPGPDAIEDITRFNEAIDQAVAESLQFHLREREQWRQLFLGVLGHDLRGPLNAIALTTEVMRAEGVAPASQTDLLLRGTTRLTALLNTLLEYSRTVFGTGMALERRHASLATACAEELELLQAAHPGVAFVYEVNGDTEGMFDVSRVREALENLVSNALKHGDPDVPPLVRIEGHGSSVRITVENAGEIPPDDIEMLFEPLRRGDIDGAKPERTHLGLGLFIARQIARAHGGEITGTCRGGRVRFTIELPRAPSGVADTIDTGARRSGQ